MNNHAKQTPCDRCIPVISQNQGIGKATANFVEKLFLREMPFDVVLFGRKMLGPSLSKIVPHGAKVRHLRVPRSWEFVMENLHLVERLCKGDVYHATDFYLPLGSNTPAIATIHDLIYEVESEVMVDHVRLRRWTPNFVRQCKHIITVSEHSKKDIVRIYDIEPERVHVIYWGIDRDFLKPPQDRDELRENIGRILGLKRPFFLGVSCSTGRKNTLSLLEAYESLINQGSDSDLVLVWDPPQFVRERYSQGPLAKRIHFIGKQSGDMLRDLYSTAIAMIYPSLYEGFGLPVLEAMSCGSPVITSNTTSLPEVGGEVAYYIDPKDSSSILHAMSKFEDGSINISELREKSLEQAGLFTWDRCVDETLNVYTRCFEEIE